MARIHGEQDVTLKLVESNVPWTRNGMFGSAKQSISISNAIDSIIKILLVVILERIHFKNYYWVNL